ncbi:MAG TPA: ABC transporter permease [Shinella sp.]|jgi:peptide/nickel transport system permease protein|uniref:ABC transporter permease n=1 Tax=Shinella sp. TaxID=1870904 RepID=UPI00299FBF41|nr:ABC transporter permease [Shinella sp.]MDX3974166.1 ABC transporter permease [Shinella sp.]HEV7250540.1 ABC transporter permease [Shinella sp.]
MSVEPEVERETMRVYFARLWDSDLAWNFRNSPLAVLSATVLFVIAFTSIFAGWLMPQNPFDIMQLFLDKANLPPVWSEGGEMPYLLGTDMQGRDVLSAIVYGSRISLVIGLASVAVSMTIGVLIGLLAGYIGGALDNLLMRLADAVMSIPTLLVAILVSAIFRGLLPVEYRDTFAPAILVLALSLTSWVVYARMVRAVTMVEARKEYVMAARIINVPRRRIILKHILPNVMTPALVTGTLNLGLAILAEATLSFLGVGMPSAQPSLGTLIRLGNEYFFSGTWWIVLFPALQLTLIILAVNLLGDWLRDALNPKLK